MNEEGLRLTFRTRALDSLYFFSKVVLGFKDMTPQLHLEVCLFLEAAAQCKLIVLPRGHLKTSLCTIAYPLWRAIRNPEIRILLTNATGTNASHFLRSIEAVVESNTLFRWLFPEVLPDMNKVKWTEREMELKRKNAFPEATIEAAGVGTSVVSRHFDLIIEDDLVNEDHILSYEQMNKVVEWHKYATSLRVDPGRSEEIVIGTRWAFNDVISHVVDNEPHYAKLYKSVYDVEGNPIWPERFNTEVLDAILETQGNRIFSCQYLNNPVAEDPRSFDASWIRRFTELPSGPLSFVLAVDPAISQSKGDYTGMIVLGTSPDTAGVRDRYVVEARRGRWGVDEMIDVLFELVRTWKPRVGIETVMFQKALLYPIREAMRRHNLTFRIEELKPSSKVTKEGRISALHEFFANGSLWLRTGQADLERELKEFPYGLHDDLIDALAYAIQMSRPAQKTELPLREDPLALESVLRELRKRNANTTVSTGWVWHTPYEHVPERSSVYATY